MNNNFIGAPTPFNPTMETNQGGLPIHNDVTDYGNGISQGQAMGTGNYIKQLDNGLSLHVHAPNGIITGAKVFDGNNSTIINNTQAALLDTLPGTIKQNTGMQR